jgi:hypothetical protein
VQEAAGVLGTSVDAVRMRVRRGSLESDKDPDGRVYVWVDPDESETRREAQIDGVPLVEVLREQVAYLQGVIATRDQELATRAEELRRRDAALEREQQLTAYFAERLAALEAPTTKGEDPREDAPESAESPEPTDTPPGRDGNAQEATEAPEQAQRSWWRRMFGFDSRPGRPA